SIRPASHIRTKPMIITLKNLPTLLPEPVTAHFYTGDLSFVASEARRSPQVDLTRHCVNTSSSVSCCRVGKQSIHGPPPDSVHRFWNPSAQIDGWSSLHHQWLETPQRS